jgi:hypothetical protein
MSRAVEEALATARAAMLAYAEAVGAPDENGIAARVITRVRMLRAADAYGHAVMAERDSAAVAALRTGGA